MRPSSRVRALEAREVLEGVRDSLRVKDSSAESKASEPEAVWLRLFVSVEAERMDVSASEEARESRSGSVEVEVGGCEGGVGNLHSGYSSSKRWIIRCRVESRN